MEILNLVREFLYSSKHDTNKQSLRTGLYWGIGFIGVFGIIDPFMMPSNHYIPWVIRYIFIIPLAASNIALSFIKGAEKYTNLMLIGSLYWGFLGILTMIYFTKPSDPAYYAYYAGLVQVYLWSSFMFRLSFKATVFFSVSVSIGYNLVAIFRQEMLSYGFESTQFAWFIGNNFFLNTTAILAIVGAYYMDNYKAKIEKSTQELKKEREELKIAKEKAEESNHLKTTFLANMSHEVRTPLNGIMSSISLLEDYDISVEDRKAFIDLLKKSCKRLLSTMTDIMEISKIETDQVTAEKVQFDLNILFVELFNDYKNFSNKNIQLNYTESIENLNILSDYDKLTIIMKQLIENAFKFTNEGAIEFGFKIENDNILVFVKDTGVGIPQHKQKIIFDVFVQADMDYNRSHEGTGLGLSISKAYIELMGGKIWVESTVGEGSTFYFTIPYVQAG